jgi:uncharacterized SAM-binding protein YcdF (DUF218 family)
VYFLLKQLIRSIILPPGAPLILAVLGALLIARRRRFGWVLLIAGVGSLWLLCTPIVADDLSDLAERYPALDLNKPTGAQAVVILGGGGERVNAPEYAGAVADSVLLERLTYGAFVAHRTALPVLVTGAPPEAIAMEATLVRDLGITPRWVEGQSRDTYQNARFSERLLRADGVKKVILVTSSTHEWRAVHEFLGVGLEVVPAPAGVLAVREQGVSRLLPSASALMRSNAAVYELIGEPMRRLQAALGVRERFDKSVGAVVKVPPEAPAPAQSAR